MTTAASAKTARRALDREVVDLVLLDVHLARAGESLEVAAHAQRVHPMPAIVAMSGEASRAELWALARLGVHAYFEKPHLPMTVDELFEAAADGAPLGPRVKPLVGTRRLRDVMDEVRDAMQEQALALHRGNRVQASRALGISRRALQKAERRR